jgi:hypothetical protein
VTRPLDKALGSILSTTKGGGTEVDRGREGRIRERERERERDVPACY